MMSEVLGNSGDHDFYFLGFHAAITYDTCFGLKSFFKEFKYLYWAAVCFVRALL